MTRKSFRELEESGLKKLQNHLNKSRKSNNSKHDMILNNENRIKSQAQLKIKVRNKQNQKSQNGRL